MKRGFFLFLIAVFLVTSLNPGVCQAQSIEPLMPPVGQMVGLSPAMNPPILQGMTIHPENPFQFDFILDEGKSGPRATDDNALKQESEKLIKYFLASLTIPKKDLWVNLSPYEKNRIVPAAFGQTVMGRDLLAQDYLLKQLTASLISPEKELGKNFWERVYQTLYAQYPHMLNQKDFDLGELFNSGKVWIVPDGAEVYVEQNDVVILNSHLKVMMEEDYLSMPDVRGKKQDAKHLTSDVIKQVIIPTLEREVNEGTHFASLRQIYHSMILATWFKQNLEKSLLAERYANQKKIEGVAIEDKEAKDKIYQQYVESFKRGVFDLIKEEYDPVNRQVVPRKYFAGGLGFTDFAMTTTTDALKYAQWEKGFQVSGRTLARLQGVYARADHPQEFSDLAMATNPDGLNEQEIESIINLPDDVIFPQELRPLMDEYAAQKGGTFAGIHQVRGNSEDVIAYLSDLMELGRVKKNDVIAIRFELLVDHQFTRAGIFADRVSNIIKVLSLHDLREPKYIWLKLAYFSGNRYQYFNNLTLEYMNLAANLNGLSLQGRGIGKTRLVNLREALKAIIPGKKIILNDVTSIVNASILEKYLGAVFYQNKEVLDKGTRPAVTELRAMITQINAQAKRDVIKTKIRLYVDKDENSDVINDGLNGLLHVNLRLAGNPTQELLDQIIGVISFLTDPQAFQAAIQLQADDQREIDAQAQRLYMEQYMHNTGKFVLVAQIPGELKERQDDEAMAVKTAEAPRPAIPADAYNALAIEELGSAVGAVKEIVTNMPEHFLSKAIQESFQATDRHLSYDEHIQFLQTLGAQADLKGPSVYMPFGGFDTFTPFTLVKGAQDVFSVGLDSFGTPGDIFHLLFNAEGMRSLMATFRTFDYVGQYVHIKNVLMTEGLGALAVLRTIALLKGEVKRISYFQINPSGEITFLNEAQVVSTKADKNAVIEYYDPADKIMKRFWYIRQDLTKEDKAFEAFINHLPFQTLLIKAPFVQKGYWRDSFAPRIFTPAKKNHARVFHDQLTIGDKYPHGIWKPKFNPQRITLKAKESFGYSGRYVYYGDAKDLRDKPLDLDPEEYDAQRVYQTNLAQELLKQFPGRYENRDKLFDLVDHLAEGFETLDEKLAQVWADFSFSRAHINQIAGIRRVIIEDISNILAKADSDDAARAFAWRMGMIAYENSLKEPWKHKESMLLEADKDYTGGTFLDLASGPRAVRYFANLNPKNKYIFVDNRYEIEGFINRAIEEYGAYDYIEFRRADLSETEKIFLEGEQYDYVQLNDIDSYVPNLGKDFVERIVSRIKPQGRIMVAYSPVRTADTERWVLPILGPMLSEKREWTRTYQETTWGRERDDVIANSFINGEVPEDLAMVSLTKRNQAIIDNFYAQEDKVKVVDFGSSFGEFFNRYEQRFFGHTIIGFDNLGLTSEELERHLQGKFYINPRVVLRDAGKTGLKPNSIDKVIINMPNPDFMEKVMPKFIKEAQRILKPGGEIVIVFQKYSPNVIYEKSTIRRGEAVIRRQLKAKGFQVEVDGDNLREGEPHYPQSRYIREYEDDYHVPLSLFKAIKPQAVLGEDEQRKGGIDLNSDLLDMTAKGSSLQLPLPPNSEGFFNGDFPGLTPIIYSIIPIMNN